VTTVNDDDPVITLDALRSAWAGDGWHFICDPATKHYFALRETSATGREVLHAPTAKGLAGKLEAEREQ
jgi:hypothetical protein